jgi:TolA-binding protein
LAASLLGAAGGDVRLGKPPGGDAPAERLFVAAVRSFQGGHWATSARWFQELIRRHPNSPRRPSAVLMLAQSLFKQGDLKEAHAVLAKDRMAAGPEADEFLFWMAECRTGQGNLEAAAQIYQELLREHPQSPRAAEAIVALANVSARQEDWVKVIGQLQPTDGVFQEHAARSPGDEPAVEGRLLLAQALFEQGNLPAAGTALDTLSKQLGRGQDWRRRLLRARIAEADGKIDEAGLLGDRLRTLAEQQNSMGQRVSACQFRAQLFEGKSEWDQAAQEWSHLLKEELPVGVRTYAFLNMVRARIRGGDHLKALTVLEHLHQQPGLKSIHPVADCLMGELHLALHRAGGKARLDLAVLHFGKLTGHEQNPSLQAQALWGLAQCHLAKNEPARAREALHQALEVVPGEDLRARIQYQLALGQSRMRFHAGAAIGFQNVRTNVLEGISAELLNAARFMQFKNTLAGENLAGAEVLLAEMRAQAGASHLDKALLAMARARIDRRETEAAKTMLVAFHQQAPGSGLQAAAALEAIRLLVINREWTKVNTSYQQWLEKYPRHPDRPKVLFDQAWALAQSGEAEGAVKKFNQLIQANPGTPPAFMARMWLADRAYNTRGDLLIVEKKYKEIQGATNCPPTLRHRAGMMAGRAAMERQGFDEARAVFTALIDDGQVKTNSPSIHVEASFALGDLTMLELGSEVQNQIEKLTQSTNAFHRLIEMAPTNAVAARAWGRIGDCCLMISGDRPDYHAHAKAAYEKSLAVTGPVPVRVRNQARVGLAQALERQTSAGEERDRLRREAVVHLLAVFYGRHLEPGEKLDLYWRRQSGLMSQRLLTELGSFDQALQICAELKKDFPGMRPGLKDREQQINKLRAAKQP